MNNETNVASIRPLRGVALALAITSASALAGTSAKSTIVESPEPEKGFCDWLSNKPGTLYKNKENPYIQELGIFGRFHYQHAWIDGSSDGKDFWYDNEGDFRRARLGARAKFLNYFHIWANADMVRDTRPAGGDADWDYHNLYEAKFLFDAQKAFDIDNHSRFTLGYGKSEVKTAYESQTSSKKIKTVERSAISNKIFQTTLTGAWLDACAGNWSYYGGVFSTAWDEEIASWNAGELYHARLAYDTSDCLSLEQSELSAAFAYADNDDFDGISLNYEWAGALAFTAEQGRANYMANLIFGENRDDALDDRGGSFWGVVFMPSYWLIDNDLEAVFRYQYQAASEDKGIRINSRYARTAGAVEQEDISLLRGGRGDQHHSAYLGLNYYFCGNHSKVMAGVEYDDLESDGDDIYHGFTYFLAYRMYF
ncbi:hypothetical protein HW115_12400 [Verrucomicrobiaceae bacterium N1E253]|uniref:Porin n=1 Tax=Oceaniferula marina TaxID=2748318 RepID=A0A851GGC6_9BACT|nr:porin [Oceaniferula marina]NWK56416.1 hypothetical protein [Oceaniferula marina]